MQCKLIKRDKVSRCHVIVRAVCYFEAQFFAQRESSFTSAMRFID